MTLLCDCGSHAVTIINQSYSEGSAFEEYECETCGRNGSFQHDDVTGTTSMAA
jgi:hypothetical protein